MVCGFDCVGIVCGSWLCEFCFWWLVLCLGCLWCGCVLAYLWLGDWWLRWWLVGLVGGVVGWWVLVVSLDCLWISYRRDGLGLVCGVV